MNLFESLLRTLATALVLTAAITLSAQGPGPNVTPGIFIQPANGPMPKYAAGTCNTLYANIYAFPSPGGGGCSIVLARLYLGNDSVGWTKVDEYAWQPEEPIVSTTTLGVRFDSTHYLDGTNLGVKVQYLDNLGRYFYETKYHPVKNKALLGNYDFGDFQTRRSYPTLESAIGASYSVRKKVDGDLLTPAWKNEVPGASFVYVSTHGTPGVYTTQSEYPLSDVSVGPSSDEDSHGGWLASAMGVSFPFNSTPPYNNPSLPPANFVFLDSCNTLDLDASSALYPFFNQYAGLGITTYTNQFVAGWRELLDVHWTKLVAEKLSAPLFAGVQQHSP